MNKPCIKFGPWIFSPSLVSSLTTLLLIPFLVYIGFWQLHRFEEKQKSQQYLESRLNEPVMALSSVSHLSPALRAPSPARGRGNIEVNKIRYRQLQVTGTFLNENPILLDNQISEGQVGYHVFIPFLPKGGNELLLVDRGWIPLGKNRAEFPDISPVLGKILLMGTINLPSSGLQLKQDSLSLNQINWPLRVQRIEFKTLSKLFTREFYPFILQLNPKDPNGFKVLPITLNTKPSRHLGYAIQWFAMAIAAFIYYMVINVRKVKSYTRLPIV